ncbi:hypothetical protein [Pseudarthrobacter sp. AB1]|nr:hypothetical protein [Pseudarthrobacter sp. AB1]
MSDITKAGTVIGAMGVGGRTVENDQTVASTGAAAQSPRPHPGWSVPLP